MKSTDQKKTFRADTEGVKKLTRSAQRKLTVTCIAVAAITLILLGAGLSYFNRRDTESGSVSVEEMQSGLREQMQQEMALASQYLEKLDGDIAENQNRLDEVNRQLTERQESFLKAETTQKKLEENASDVSVKVQELEKKTETQISALQNNMDSIHTDIRSTMDKITSIIEKLENTRTENDADHAQSMEEFSKVIVSVQEINQSISRVESGLDQSYQSLRSLMKELKEEEESLHELAKKLGDAERKDQTELMQQLAQMLQKLSEVEGDLKALLETDMAQIASSFSALTEEFQLRISTLSQAMDGNFEMLDQNMTGSFENLGQNVDLGFENLGQNVSGGFAELDQRLNGGFEELNQNMSGSLTDLGQSMSGNFADLDQNMERALEALGQEMDGRFVTVNQTLVKQIENLTSASGENNDVLMTYLEALKNSLKQDLNQVFTSVSDGKKGLASALLTKGVRAEEDATFAQIRDAILSIDQKIVIGVQEIPGTISYRYHYHTDASGGHPHAESSSEQGGCFTAAKQHYHTDDCYRTEQSHKHTDDCPSHPVWVDWVENPYWGMIYDCGNIPLNTSRKILKCTIEEGKTEEYQPSCGFIDGQIIGAEITYDRNSVDKQTAAQSNNAAISAAVQTAEIWQEEETLPPPLPQNVADELENEKRKEEAAVSEQGEALQQSEKEQTAGIKEDAEVKEGTAETKEEPAEEKEGAAETKEEPAEEKEGAAGTKEEPAETKAVPEEASSKQQDEAVGRK